MKYFRLFFSIILLTSFIALTYFGFYYYKNSKPILPDPILPDQSLLREVTVLTSSYDGYSELWDPHYKLLFKYWPALESKLNFIPVMLITNELIYDHPRVTSLKIGEDTNWSKNLLKALDSVKTKYTFLLLDDYIVNTPVNDDRLIEMLSLLEQRNGAYVEVIPDMGHFIYGYETKKKYVSGIKDVIYRSKNSSYRNSLQAAIWNTNELKKLIKPDESAWDFEIKGNKRTKKNPKPFYMVMDDPVVLYLNAVNRRVYRKDVVDYINNQGVEFKPLKLPVKNAQEMEEYEKSKEAHDIVSDYENAKN